MHPPDVNPNVIMRTEDLLTNVALDVFCDVVNGHVFVECALIAKHFVTSLTHGFGFVGVSGVVGDASVHSTDVGVQFRSEKCT